ncbi:hypothetical protein FNL39_11092 [Nocardia caishijiensis]|uniref:Uncharacterized protein n=1 Tax=Nocardia caishijiensis TaxID=184756 RepID=A0ABQ6YGH3_9NOCA|nr:hypothetical protein [Nocardia caishijiensis]KAF0844860.1 hypothetical protein FNL39_11092 [Nocardia caishijiensis]
MKQDSRHSYAGLSRAHLATLVPELLLCGHLIDRSGMPHTIGAFGREGMTEVAIAEWQVASPVYTRRMQSALGFVGDGVETIFKGLQLDIGAPPQFLDFRFRVDDHDHGEFWLDHCGALADVEPLGDQFVRAMCHDIEDPTFDATALATNPHAQVRPIHRPPRAPADRTPVCAWRVSIDPANEPPPIPRNAGLIAGSAAATVALSPIDPGDDGAADYRGPLLSDLRFADFSRSALIRIAEEVALQQHLLVAGFLVALRERVDAERAAEIGRKQFAGVAGVASGRIASALGLSGDLESLARVFDLHPALNPRQYVGRRIETSSTAVTLVLERGCGAITDGVWPALLDPDHLAPLDALVGGVDPHYTCRTSKVTESELVVDVVRADEPAAEAVEVALTRISTGAAFAFVDRGIPLPLTVVEPSGVRSDR